MSHLHAHTCPCLHAGHRCQKQGCGLALVLDSNTKNHRFVCCATHAGYAEFEGLQGRIRTGCPNTPALTSSSCSVHAPTVAVHCDILGEDNKDTGEDSQKLASNSEEHPVGLITEKRTTQNATLYKVHTVEIHVCLKINLSYMYVCTCHGQ